MPNAVRVLKVEVAPQASCVVLGVVHKLLAVVARVAVVASQAVHPAPSVPLGLRTNHKGSPTVGTSARELQGDEPSSHVSYLHLEVRLWLGGCQDNLGRFGGFFKPFEERRCEGSTRALAVVAKVAAVPIDKVDYGLLRVDAPY